MNNILRKLPKHALMVNIIYLGKWILTAECIGLIIGAVGAAFYHVLHFVTETRVSHPWLVFLLPAGGLLIVWIYQLCGEANDRGTNQVISAITGNDRVRPVKAPLIFFATAITHLFGGSAGRESAALQIGGCIGQNMGYLFHFHEGDRKIITMCGMSAAFAALFGTPLSAAFLAMEISSIGVLYYAALVPCALSALTANALAVYLGTKPDVFQMYITPDFTVPHAVLCGVLTILCALISILFCLSLHKGGELYNRFFPNPYVRIAVAGCLVAGLTLLSGGMMFNGAGMDIIERSFRGNVPAYAFLAKILFTTLTMSAGYKGGEIVPSLYIGATFGATFATLFGFDQPMCAAIGMAALFCGITNCPIASLLLCFEMFGYAGMPYYLITIALSYALSGYYSVYASQKIVYSKFRNTYINRQTK